MAYVREAVIGRKPARPPFYRRALDLDGGPAPPAHQMVVMLTMVTAAVELFPVRRPHVVNLARVHQQLQGAVHGRQADRHTTVPELSMKLLGTPELLGTGQQGEHFGALPRLTRNARRGPAHPISPYAGRANLRQTLAATTQ
jgi:hypothetical protein